MRIYLAVGLGGVIGSLLRYLVSTMFWTDQAVAFPWATYVVNMSGAFLLTFIVFQPFIIDKLPPILFVGFTTGLIGSYTTFSMLILELITLWEDHLSLAIVYFLATLCGGLLASYAGYVVANSSSKGRA